jgi:hypothetical protein
MIFLRRLLMKAMVEKRIKSWELNNLIRVSWVYCGLCVALVKCGCIWIGFNFNKKGVRVLGC